MTVALDPAGEHVLVLDAGRLHLPPPPNDRRSPLHEALLGALEIRDARGTRRLDPATFSAPTEDDATVLLGDPVARVEGGALFEVRRLTPYEARFMAETGTVHPRRRGTANVALRTDLHTHFAGCLTAEALVEVAVEAELVYPDLDALGIRQTDGRVDRLSSSVRRTLAERLAIPADRQVPFAAMSDVYRRRSPITKHLPLLPAQLRRIAEDYAATGVRYAELSLFDVVRAEWFEVAQRCLPAIEADTGVALRFLVAFHRQDDLEWDLDMLARIDRKKESLYLAGVDFMGHETNPTDAFAAQLEAVAKWADANRPGFVVRVHAGENPAHPNNVRRALEIVGPYDVELRIGHGLYGVDDATLATLRARDVIVEFNLDSNYALNNLKRCPEAPIARYADAGVPIVIGTDGPGLYRTSIPDALETARLAGLEDVHLEHVARTEARLLARRANDEASRLAEIEVDPDPPLVHFTPEVAAAKRAERAEHEERFAAALTATGRPTIDDVDGYLAGRRIVSVAGAWKHSYAKWSEQEREVAEAFLAELVARLDPERHVLFTGGTCHGVEGVLHGLAPAEVVGVVGTSVTPDALDDRVTAFLCVGDSFYDKASALYTHVAATDGVAVFVGGGPIVNDEIQTAANLRLRRALFAAVPGAAREHAAVDPGRVVDSAALVFAALDRMGPSAPFWHRGANEVVDCVVFRGDEVLLIQRDADAASEPLAWALPGGFRETDAELGAPFVASEDARSAAVRELHEETGLDLSAIADALMEVGVFEGHARDTRDTPVAWSRSTAFSVELPDAYADRPIVGGDDARDAKWYALDALPRLAFDHKRVIKAAVRRRPPRGSPSRS
ncbi:MAG: NUDIX domain-containing protein [Deltaproteobacteria bacterium]